MPRRLRRTTDGFHRWKKNPDRTGFLGNRVRKRTPTRGLHQHTEIRALDRCGDRLNEHVPVSVNGDNLVKLNDADVAQRLEEVQPE